VRHAEAFAAAAEALVGGEPGDVVDLGSGGGVPGLVLAQRWPGARVQLVDSSVRRCAWLRGAVERLGRPGCRVVEGRAEDLARDERFRAVADLVVARGFGAPAVVAEIGGALVRTGGHLLVSEPPDAGERRGSRWPTPELARLGLGVAEPLLVDGLHFVAIARVAPVPHDVPRRSGVPAKRPRW
jgi:16S rRNA (guanine527-N7)-methyltransferase